MSSGSEPHELELVTFSNEFTEFNPLMFAFAFMPFVGYILFWRALTRFRKRNVLGRRGKITEAIIISKSESASRNLKWNKITNFQMKIEYEAVDEFTQQNVIIEKTLSNIPHHVFDSISEGYTVNIKYDPINPFMFDIDDEYFNDPSGAARTGCCRNCGSTLLTLIVAIFFVLIPWWVLDGSGMRWYWTIVIVILIPVVMIVIACVSCCVCCRNHDMIAWYKTRSILKEQTRQYQLKRRNEQNQSHGKMKLDYQLLDGDELK